TANRNSWPIRLVWSWTVKARWLTVAGKNLSGSLLLLVISRIVETGAGDSAGILSTACSGITSMAFETNALIVRMLAGWVGSLESTSTVFSVGPLGQLEATLS